MPGRSITDIRSAVALGLPPVPVDFGPASPLYARLEKFMQELVEGFQEKIEIFESVRASLEAILAEDDQQVAVKMAATANALDQTERLALARSVGRESIKARVLTSIPPRPVLEFLAQQWIKYLVVVHVRDGIDSAAWKASLATVDQLVWSVAPKVTTEDRRALANTVPGLLKNVKAGLAAAGVEDAVCFAFFKSLMRCHTAAIQTPPKPAAPSAEVKVAVAAESKALVEAGATVAGVRVTATDAAVATIARPSDRKAIPARSAKAIAGGANVKSVETIAAGAVASAVSIAGGGTPTKAASVPVTVPPPLGTTAKAAAAMAVPKAPSADTKPTSAAVPPSAAVAKLPDPAPSRRIEPLPEPGSAEDLDFTAAITMKNPFGAGEVKVDDLDFTASSGGPISVAPPGAKTLGGKPARRPAELPRNLILGSWVEILEPGGTGQPVRAKLHHVSPLESHFLFVDRQGKKVYECSRAMLSMRLKVAEIKILDGPPDTPLFESMMSGVFKKLGKPVPA